MLRPRLVVSLLVHNKGLVKTRCFAEPKYVGDPINAVRIFNEKEVDELAVFDIDATVNGVEPDYAMIRNLAAECRMPLCYGGGVKSLDQAIRIIKLGVEKVAISSAAVADPEFVTELASFVGSQSVVIVADVKLNPATGHHEIWTHNGLRNSGRQAMDFAREVASRGAGELVLNSIDRDGTMQGYDIELALKIRGAIAIPITVLGGAGSLHHIKELVGALGVVGAAAGSLFVFKGVYRAVLISYPSREKKEALGVEVSG